MECEIISEDEDDKMFDNDKKYIEKNAMKIEESVQNSFKITKNDTPPENETETINVQPLHLHKRLLKRERKHK